MLHEIEILEARRIAELAAAAREVRDRLIEKISEEQLGEPSPARGEHNPLANVGLEGLAPSRASDQLREAVVALPDVILRRLWAVM